MKLVILVTLLIGSTGAVLGQDIDALLQLLNEGQEDSVNTVLADYSYRYPGHPGVRYVRALLQTDALIAAGIYKDIIRNHAGTSYEAPALMRLGEYYYAQGLYVQSRQNLIRLMHNYPEYDEVISAVNLDLRAGIAARMVDSVYVDLAYAIKTFPTATFDIPTELDLTRLPPGIRPGTPSEEAAKELRQLRQLGTPPTSSSAVTGGYTLQAGAFGNPANASRLKTQIETVLTPVEIKQKRIAGRTLYLVWAGRYTNKEQSAKDRSLLETALGIKAFPVDYE